jgi:hypothetical protein
VFLACHTPFVLRHPHTLPPLELDHKFSTQQISRFRLLDLHEEIKRGSKHASALGSYERWQGRFFSGVIFECNRA